MGSGRRKTPELLSPRVWVRWQVTLTMRHICWCTMSSIRAAESARGLWQSPKPCLKDTTHAVTSLVVSVSPQGAALVYLHVPCGVSRENFYLMWLGQNCSVLYRKRNIFHKLLDGLNDLIFDLYFYVQCTTKPDWKSLPGNHFRINYIKNKLSVIVKCKI